MKIISIAHQKGGVGKSTLTAMLSLFLSEKGMDVAVLDTDPQGTINNLSGLISGITILDAGIPLSEIRALDYDFVFVDTPPYLSNTMPTIFELSDLIIIPTRASLPDVIAIRETVDAVKDVSKKISKLKSMIVLTQVLQRTTYSVKMQKLLESYSIPIAKTYIHQRIAYSRLWEANGIVSTGDKKAAEEVGALMKEVLLKIK